MYVQTCAFHDCAHACNACRTCLWSIFHTTGTTYVISLTQWLPLPAFVVYRVLIFLYTFGWLVAVGLQSTDRFIIYLTVQSFLLLNLSLLFQAMLTVVYATLYYSRSEKLQSLFPIQADDVEISYGQDRIRWYVKVSWVLHTTVSVLAVGVAFSYWAFLCSPLFVSNNATTGNMTSDECEPLPVNLHVHGINAVIVILDIWMSRIPFQLCHFFYTTPFTTFYLIFSVIYWVANGRTKEGVIYPILDYGAADKQMAIVFAMVLVFFPMIIYLILFGVALLRDVAFQLLKRIFFRDFRQLRREYVVMKPNTDRDVVI